MQDLLIFAVLATALFILIYHRKDKRVLRFAIFVIGTILLFLLRTPLVDALKLAGKLPVDLG